MFPICTGIFAHLKEFTTFPSPNLKARELEYVGISSHVFSRKLLSHFSPHTVLVQAVSITAEHEDSIANT